MIPSDCDLEKKSDCFRMTMFTMLTVSFEYTVVNEMFLYPSFLPSTFISSPLTNERSWQFECACK